MERKFLSTLEEILERIEKRNAKIVALDPSIFEDDLFIVTFKDGTQANVDDDTAFEIEEMYYSTEESRRKIYYDPEFDSPLIPEPQEVIDERVRKINAQKDKEHYRVPKQTYIGS